MLCLSAALLPKKRGELDLLIGTDLSALHPHAVANIDNLTLMKGMFGNGWTIMGHHSQHVQLLDNNEGVKVNFCSVERVTFSEQIENEISCSYYGTRDHQFLDAVSTESIGVSIPPKCTACKAKTENCKNAK